MKKSVIASAMLALALLSATDAQARRGGSSFEDLSFVATTKIPGQKGPLALCHLTDNHGIFSFALFTSVESYALAESGCKTSSYLPFSAEQMKMAQRDGLIDINLPVEPVLSSTAKIKNYFFGGLIGLFFLYAAFVIIKSALGNRKRKKHRTAALGKTSHVAHRVLDAMCHLAKADGDIDPGEIDTIAQIAVRLTGQTISHEKVAEMIELAETRLGDADYKRFGKGLSAGDKTLVMRGVLMVAIADGTFHPKEQQFVGKLAPALRMKGAEVQLMLQEIMRPAAAA